MPATKLGQPCWDEENVEQVFKKIGVARTDEEGVDYFLASHAPVLNIRHDGTNEELNEETLFKTLFDSKSEVQAVIHGDPGTGKSHLIHWLKLRTEDELRRGKLKKVVPILIERRTGSLKDALEQMIEQLGEDFKHYLSPVQEALSKISSDTAREKLINNIGIELRPQQRADKKREPLPRLLRDLAEVCIGSKGFRDWLCRENGVSGAVIRHLTEKHISETGDVSVSEQLPQFTEAELLPDLIYRKQTDNTQNVRDLLYEFDEGLEPELLEKAVSIFNEVLPDAIKELTGLTGTSLRDIFDLIRTDLKKRGQTLAVFIEDVSQMAVLDEDVFAAVEPQLRKGLCRMIAVVGSTEQVWNRIPDNQKDRVTHPISLGGNAIIDWQTDTQAVAEFTARYLNTVRLTREQISAVAANRRENGEDINLSACDNCHVREECHTKFGKTQVGKVEVGLFPFSKTTPKRLLNYLNDRFNSQKNARGLLARILLPTMDNGYELLRAGEFPNPQKFAVSLPELPFWGPFKQNFCGKWSDKDIYRLEFLAQGWFKTENADDLAMMLEPFLEPLGFPQFSKRHNAPSKTIKTSEVEKPREFRKVIEPAINTKLNKILQDLKSWMSGDKLHEDVEIRKLLADLVRGSIVWDDITSPPREVWKNLIGGSEYAFVEIEAQFHSPQSTLVYFPRNEDTRNLIEALAQFKYAGTGSWDFEHGEYHKRTVAQWLRRNQQIQIIAQLQPPATIDTNMPIASAIQILATSALVRQRARLSSDLSELLKSILADNWNEEPFALSKEWKELAKDMQLKHKDVLSFIRNELNIPQGTGGIIFINSIPALNAALDFASAPKIQIPSEDYHQRFWKSRYAIFQNKAKYTNFLDALRTERAAIDETIESIKSALKRLDYDTEIPDVLTAFCEDFIELLKTQVDAKETEPFAPLSELGGGKFFASRKEVWQTAFKRAQSVVADEDAMQTLTFNPQTLEEAKNSVLVAFEYISRVDNYVMTRLQQFEDEGDPDLLTTALLDSLENIGKM